MGVRQAFELQHQTFFRTIRTLQSAGRAAGALTNIYTKFNVMQIRLQDAAKNYREAQEAVNQAFAEGGPLSEDYAQAVKNAADAQQELKRAQDESILGMAGFGVEIIGTVALIAGQLIPQIKNAILWLRRMRNLSIGSLAGAAAAGGATTLPGMKGAGKVAGLGAGAAGLAGAAAVGVPAGVAVGIGNTAGITSIGDMLTGGNFTGYYAALLKQADRDVTGGMLGGVIDFLFGGKGGEFEQAAGIGQPAPVIQQYNFYGYDADEANSAASDSAEQGLVFGQ